MAIRNQPHNSFWGTFSMSTTAGSHTSVLCCDFATLSRVSQFPKTWYKKSANLWTSILLYSRDTAMERHANHGYTIWCATHCACTHTPFFCSVVRLCPGSRSFQKHGTKEKKSSRSSNLFEMHVGHVCVTQYIYLSLTFRSLFFWPVKNKTFVRCPPVELLTRPIRRRIKSIY